MRRSRIVSLVLLCLVGACGSSGTPTSPPTSPAPTSAPPLSEVIVVGAPSVVHAGSRVSLQAAAKYADGTFLNVTGTATWRSSNGACRVDAGGTVEAVGAGTAQVTAEFAGRTSAPVSISCGYFITVTTHENFPTEHVRVAGVRGEITTGPQAGVTFETDANGVAALPPVAGPGFGIQFKKAGFENYTHVVETMPRELQLRIPLVPEFTARVAFHGQCSAASFQRLVENYTFATMRTGKIRMTVDLTSDGLAPYAYLYGTIEAIGAGGGAVQASALVRERPPLSPNTPVAEMRVDAGSYRMHLTALENCTPTDFWRVTLEYSR